MTDIQANKVHSATFGNSTTEYYETGPLSNFQEPSNIMPSNQSLELLNQIIEMADQIDAEYKKRMGESPTVKDWEQSFGEGWMPFHLKKLKGLLTSVI